MNATEMTEPPRKKRCFFVDDEPTGQILDWTPRRQDTCESHSTHVPDASKQDEQDKDYKGSIVSPSPSRVHDMGNDTLQKATLEAFLDVDIDDATFAKLRKASGDDMDKALNLYLDGTLEHPAPVVGTGSLQPLESNRGLFTATSKPKVALEVHQSTMPTSRYIGAFGVNGWATRSGRNLIRIGDKVTIERTKIMPTGKAGRANFRRIDVIVRFLNKEGSEVGRLPKETAIWVSALMDQKICQFEGECFYAPEQIRVNDSIALQIKCSLLTQAFDKSGLVGPVDDNRRTGIFEEEETLAERDLRMKQIGMMKLFEEINLQPVSVNATTAKHKRQGILQATDVAEHYEKSVRPDNASPNHASQSPDNESEDGEELEQDQLDSLYRKAQTFDFDMPEYQPAETFTLELRKYQRQALHWMINKERDEQDEFREKSMHPLWEEYRWPTKDAQDRVLSSIENMASFYINPYSGEMSLDFPAQEQRCFGGILADEMGLGKTIEMLSLIHTNRATKSILPGTDKIIKQPLTIASSPGSRVFAPRTTLVVAPMSLLAQWQSEAVKASTPGSLKTMMYYGSEKVANLQSMCSDLNAANAPHVIITSYGVVLSEFVQAAAKGNLGSTGSGLFSLQFFRIILDEAHFIKNRQSKTAKACYGLNARHRWVLTGTPIVNRLEDLFSLVHFLRVEPWSNFSFWKTFITVPFESKDFIRALDVVQTVLEPLVLRRTKDMRTPDGQSLVPLPPKTIQVEELQLSKHEKEIYDLIFTRAKRTFNATVEAGTLLKSYTTIFAQILRLRQSCCHPTLTRNKTIAADEEEREAMADELTGLADDMDLQELIDRFTAETENGSADEDVNNKYGAHVLKEIQAQVKEECPICSEEPMIEPVVTGCWHSACKKCLLEYISHQQEKMTEPLCFNCRVPINQRDIFEIVHHDTDPLEDHQPFQKFALLAQPQSSVSKPCSSPSARISLRRINKISSAKITALVAHLKALRQEMPGTKVVVFSQFTSFLDLIATALTIERIPQLRFDGGMTQKARADVLAKFTGEDGSAGPSHAVHKYGTVLLLSLRAGGVGLNLTSAKRVFMMDPWWSFAVEAQAIDRVHRMGQDHEVKVVRFIVEGSIEGRMLKVQERKKFMWVPLFTASPVLPLLL